MRQGSFTQAEYSLALSISGSATEIERIGTIKNETVRRRALLTYNRTEIRRAADKAEKIFMKKYGEL